jgi:hypothetical protein
LKGPDVSGREAANAIEGRIASRGTVEERSLRVWRRVNFIFEIGPAGDRFVSTTLVAVRKMRKDALL